MQRVNYNFRGNRSVLIRLFFGRARLHLLLGEQHQHIKAQPLGLRFYVFCHFEHALALFLEVVFVFLIDVIPKRQRVRLLLRII